MNEIISVALITLLAVISPGADFAMVTRNSYLYGRKTGLLTTLGIGLGVQVHVFYTMIGVGLLIATQPEIFTALKIVGALYLIYVGYQTFFSGEVMPESGDAPPNISNVSALKIGFLTNALNPKTTLFVLSTYTQIVQPSTSIAQQYGYGIFMSAAHWVWFGLVCVFFSTPHLRSKMLARQKPINQTIGGVLAALGGLLAFSSIAH
ncbi:MAG: LysE family translocator [Formosimonas sp.]|jgi:threonine/homoserine/homoserine lactone efflux protein